MLGEGFHRLIKHCNSWSVALRYQAQAEHRNRRRRLEATQEFTGRTRDRQAEVRKTKAALESGLNALIEKMDF